MSKRNIHIFPSRSLLKKSLSIVLSFLILLSGVSPSIAAISPNTESIIHAEMSQIESISQVVDTFIKAIPTVLSTAYSVLITRHKQELLKSGIAFQFAPNSPILPSTAKNQAKYPTQVSSPTVFKAVNTSASNTKAIFGSLLQMAKPLSEPLSITTAINRSSVLLQSQGSLLSQAEKDLQNQNIEFATIWPEKTGDVSLDDEKEKATTPPIKSSPPIQQRSRSATGGGGGGGGATASQPPTTSSPASESAEEKPTAIEANGALGEEENQTILFPEIAAPNSKEEELLQKKRHLKEDAGLRKQVINAEAMEKSGSSYTLLMKDIGDYNAIKRESPFLESEETEVSKNLADDLRLFIVQEKEKLGALSIPESQKEAYLNRLQSQLDELEGKKGILQRIEELFKGANDEDANKKEVKTPQKPASFGFSEDTTPIRVAPTIELNKPFRPTLPKSTDTEEEQAFLQGIPKAIAYTETQLPELGDVRADTSEILINQEIKDLARYLSNNPVTITNFVRNTITYEPYAGAKKGSIGCLREKVCNDIDTASLLISLLRASNVPARYRHQVIYPSINQLKNLLGVDEARAVLAAYQYNKHQIYLSGTQSISGGSVDTVDLTNVTHVALEWTTVEAFVEYDERGGNIDIALDFSSATTTTQARDLIRNNLLMQWIPIDAVFKTVNHTANEIVHDTASFNMESFWYGFLQYQGQLSPLQKYRADLLSATGKDIFTAAYQSQKALISETYSILPYELPYATIATLGGSPAVNIAWSSVPNTQRQQLEIVLEQESNQSVVFRQTLFGREVNNIEMDLLYEGSTQADKDAISNFGGIHSAPSDSVYIVPTLRVGNTTTAGTAPIRIGDSLLLKFKLQYNGQTWYEDQKFSTAGNHEGIFISLSKVEDDPSLSTNSNILLRGNVGLARKYLQKLEENGNTLKKALDYEYNIMFSRAVVTQNRILTMSNGVPTTFTFKGLTLDASTWITDYSNRGAYRNHQKDFRLLWPMDASYHEGQIFEDIAGLKGISTIKGLQFAYARPAEYTIHTISTARGNESTIDTLTLSANTKQNMHTAVQNGGTVVTPDKALADANWNGVLYIALRADWTGTYAIGEQATSNGGWTTDTFGTLVECQNATCLLESYKQLAGNQRYSYADQSSDLNGIQCRRDQTWFDTVKATKNDTTLPVSQRWNEVFGFPCATQTKTFGTVDHTYILASKGSKFYSPGLYNYWATEAVVKGVLEADKNNTTVENLLNVRFNKGFKFNPIAGTYSWFGFYDKPFTSNHPLTGYYQPDSAFGNRGIGRVVYGDILEKLQEPHFNPQSYLCAIDNQYCGKYNWILNILGYPTNERAAAASSFKGTNGHYQDFVGGQIYWKTSGRNKTYYVPGFIDQYYNSVGGTSGSHGFPVEDPAFAVGGNTLLIQAFESEGIQWDIVFQTFGIAYAPLYHCLTGATSDEFLTGKALLNGLWDSGNDLVKGAILFVAFPAVLGTGIDIAFGTHGAATVVAWTMVGGAAIVIINEAINMGLSGISLAIRNEIQVATGCSPRQAYLVARYLPDIAALVLGIGSLNQRAIKQVQGFSMTSSILKIADNAVISNTRSKAHALLDFLSEKPLVNNFKPTLAKDSLQSSFNTKVTKKSKRLNRQLTESELGLVASEVYSTDISKLLGWKRFSNKNPNSIIDNLPFEGMVSELKIVGGKLRNNQGGELRGTVNFAIRGTEIRYGELALNAGPTSQLHSQLFKGADVDFAGTMLFDNNGRLTEITNLSGHYLPTNADGAFPLAHNLQLRGVVLSGVKIREWSPFLNSLIDVYVFQ